MQEVRGLGVVGAQPLLQPGESFEYTSGASIATPVGTMRGSYQMVAEDGTRFEARDPGVHAVGAAHPALSYLRLFLRPGKPDDEGQQAEHRRRFRDR